MRMLRWCLLVVVAAGPAFGQAGPGRRIDVLTGEPVRPPSGRSEPDIFNAPHAPRQQSRSESGVPLDVYIAPQVGVGTDYLPNGAGGLASPPVPGRTLRQYQGTAREQPVPRWRHDAGPIAPGLIGRERQRDFPTYQGR